MRRISNFQWILILIGCALLVYLISTTSLYLGINEPEKVQEDISQLAPFWAFWVIHAPVIVLLSRRISFERRHLIKSLPIYIAAGIAWAIFVQSMPLLMLPLLKILTSYDIEQLYQHKIDWAAIIVQNVIIFWVILSSSLIFSYYERYQKEILKASTLDAQLSNSRLQALKMQLQPHFLFNTLHSISALVLKNENRDAVKMINRLSELLRLSLDNIETQIVSLADEIEFTRRYLEIELIRFKDRLKVEWEIDANALNAKVPNLILQPLVENAMRHAVDLNSGTSRIKISANLKDKQIWLKVSDDGKNAEKIAAQNDASGLGLKNTRARLAELYGEDFRFDLSRKDDWTTAQIVIPFSPIKQNSEGENR